MWLDLMQILCKVRRFMLTTCSKLIVLEADYVNNYYVMQLNMGHFNFVCFYLHVDLV